MSVADRGDDRHQAREAIVGEDGHVLVESPSIPMAVCDLSVISRLGECPSAAVALTREQAKAVAAALDPALVAERDRYETERDEARACIAWINGGWSDEQVEFFIDRYRAALAVLEGSE